MLTEAYTLIGFILAAYAIVADDSIQTLGTYLSSNSDRPWWLLCIFAGSTLLIVLVYGWIAYDGDPAFGRLEKFPIPDEGINRMNVIAPLVLLVLTGFGVPISTTFMVLTVFTVANISNRCC